MSHPASLRILVCGDADRGDNGAPLIAISRLLPTLPRPVLDQLEVRRREQLDVGDLVDLGPGEACVIVDTATEVEPGAIVMISLEDLARNPGRPIPRSAHVSRIDEGIRTVSASRGGVPPGSFVGIGGRSFGFGVPLSIPVRGALPAFTTAIGSEIGRLLGIRVGEPG
jgi:Ni,Fe-hydrogenase maturation factor